MLHQTYKVAHVQDNNRMTQNRQYPRYNSLSGEVMLHLSYAFECGPICMVTFAESWKETPQTNNTPLMWRLWPCERSCRSSPLIIKYRSSPFCVQFSPPPPRGRGPEWGWKVRDGEQMLDDIARRLICLILLLVLLFHLLRRHTVGRTHGRGGWGVANGVEA